MFLGLMLVGYATSKLTDRKVGNMSWLACLLGQKAPAPQPAPEDDAIWNLGAEAWVTVPPQRDC